MSSCDLDGIALLSFDFEYGGDGWSLVNLVR